jgi:4-hydroxy-tetrahydrodipicolinate synthase
MQEIGRLLTAMVTPFDDNGALDYAQARKLALSLLDTGSDGLVVVGTTGESPTLDWEEHIRLFKEIKSAVGERGSVVAGTGSNSTAEAINATREAEKLGVDACLLVVPYYNKPSQEGLYQHFRAIAAATSLPCILYNVPSRTVTSLSAETIIRLSHTDNIIGVKEAGGSMKQVAEVIAGAAPGFKVWSGNDADNFAIMTLGGYGAVSVASHLVGKQIKEMIDLVLAGEVSRAAAIHRKMTRLNADLFILSNPVPLKYALNYLGFNVGKPRLPLVEPDAQSAAIVRETLAEYHIDLKV